MCDQDHFEKDRQDYEALGLVITRRQFGVMLGAGMAMMLPEVANAVTVTESEVTVMTPDGTADGYLCIRRPARPPVFWCGRTSSGCGRRSGKWANGSPNPAIRFSW